VFNLVSKDETDGIVYVHACPFNSTDDLKIGFLCRCYHTCLNHEVGSHQQNGNFSWIAMK